MKDYKIEKGVPLPTANTTRPYKYPWQDMEVGDSILIDKPIKSIAPSITYYTKNHNPKWKFTCRTVEGGTRVWRVK